MSGTEPHITTKLNHILGTLASQRSYSPWASPWVNRRLHGLVAFCAVFLIVALYVVGVVSHGVLRHLVQTAPMWPTVILGLRDSRWSKWTAIPCFCCWLLLMSLIWFFLLGWAHVISGTFSPVEVAMTFVVGVSSILGLVTGLRTRSRTSAAGAAVVCFLTLVVQVLAFKVSFSPGIAHD